MMIGRGQHLLMADADGATRTSDLARLEDALKQLNDPGSIHNIFCFFLTSMCLHVNRTQLDNHSRGRMLLPFLIIS